MKKLPLHPIPGVVWAHVTMKKQHKMIDVLVFWITDMSYCLLFLSLIGYGLLTQLCVSLPLFYHSSPTLHCNFNFAQWLQGRGQQQQHNPNINQTHHPGLCGCGHVHSGGELFSSYHLISYLHPSFFRVTKQRMKDKRGQNIVRWFHSWWTVTYLDFKPR